MDIQLLTAKRVKYFMSYFGSDEPCCGVYGKRLKLVDRIWNSNGLLTRTNSSCSYSMQKEKSDISDEDCCIIAEIPRRKKPGLTAVQKTTEPASCAKTGSIFPIPWTSFSFQKDSQEKNGDDKETKTVSKFSGKDDNNKVQPRKFFHSQRASITQGKLARCRLSYRNQLRKKMSFLQESYRLSEKFQYMKLLQSHMTYNLMTVKQPLKCIKSSDSDKPIEIIELSDDEVENTQGNVSTRKKQEDQDVQIVGEVSAASSFQDVLKFRPMNADIAFKKISNHYKNNLDVLRHSNNQIDWMGDEIIEVDQKTEALEERLRNFMQISGPRGHEVENREPYYLPELKAEQERRVKQVFISEPSLEVLSQGFGLQITRQDLQTLVGLNWLNDEVINFYMNLIMERSKVNRRLPKVYAFNTFFYPKLVACGYSSLRRWTKQVDIFSFDMVLVPVHLGMHWCLAVIDFRSKSVKYYDSVGSPNNPCLDRLLLYLTAESLDKKNKAYATSGWVKSNVEDIPQQMNGGDCGVFCCMFAEHLARDCSILFTQDDMPYFRKKMVIEILEKKLLT